MKSSNVYKKAAQLIKNNNKAFACLAIKSAMNKYDIDIEDNITEIKRFEKYFKPRGLPRDVTRDTGWFGTPLYRENQIHREIALLFMAEITKDLK